MNTVDQGSSAGTPEEFAILVRRHLKLGWWSLLVFLTAGVFLEGLHAFKLPDYLGVSHGTRRLMWTLAHAHGTGLSLVHLAFAAAVAWRTRSDRTLLLASRCLTGGAILIPLGFFLGGFSVAGGDPGPGIVLVPPGALMLFMAIFLTARSVSGPSARS